MVDMEMSKVSEGPDSVIKKFSESLAQKVQLIMKQRIEIAVLKQVIINSMHRRDL